MNTKLEPFRRYIYIGIITTALGITFSTTLKKSVGLIGIVFIAIGGVFFIIGMIKKRKEDNQKNT